jgi:O-succinylbenzoate synthase
MMIEQPLDYDDIALHATLAGRIRTPICLDESMHSVRRAAEAIAAGACRIINIKPGRVGGHAESIAMHDLAAGHGVPVWHGGMLESGIGRAHNIHLSTLPNFSLPGDVAASRRYYAPDLIDPEIEVRPDGTIAVPTGPGIGVAIVMDRVEAATEEHRELRPGS